MNPATPDEFTESLALVLIYLSSWTEKELDTDMRRAWKGYDFSILDQLKEEGLIHFSDAAKSLYLTQDGVSKARGLAEKLRAAFTG